MNRNTVIGLAVLGGALYFLMMRRGATAAGGSAWGPGVAGRVYDPTLYAGGDPSYAGSSGSGNMNPLATTLGTISNLLKGFTYRQTAGSAPVSYGTPSAPGAANGPSTKTGVSAPSFNAPLYRGALVDPEGFLFPIQDWTAQLTTATPAAIASQGASQSIPLGAGIFF